MINTDANQIIDLTAYALRLAVTPSYDPTNRDEFISAIAKAMGQVITENNKEIKEYVDKMAKK